MHQSECYRLLGLSRNASLEDIKLSYRRLARKYHPDLNSDDPSATDKFRLIQQAYQLLKDVELGVMPRQTTPEPAPTPEKAKTPPHRTPEKVKVEVRSRDVRQKVDPIASDPELRLRLDTLRHLQDLLKQRKYIVAIAVAEGMKARFPNSPEVTHWLAVTYHRWGNELILKSRWREAEIFLQKALNTDPNNRELSFEVRRDLERVAQNSN